MSLPVYEIYAIKYAERVGNRGTIFVFGDPHDAPLGMDYFVWVIKNDERTVVVDCGFTKEEGESRGRTFLRCPAESLSLVGVDAATVTDLVITHMHYDHSGNLDKFPNATFHIQDEEVHYVTGRAMTHKGLRHSYVLSDVQEMIAAVYGDRVMFHDGDDDLFPGITLHHIPGHTWGQQSLKVNTKRGQVVVASDAAHYYESLEKGTPFLTHESIFGMLEGFRKLNKLAGSPDLVVPGHDPLVMQRYPAMSPETEGVVCLLHEPPNVG
ncbi:MAG: N-acyl homoserine lactonase family protein [Rhodospirillaceae bacterium]